MNDNRKLFYSQNIESGEKYGLLYNWFAVGTGKLAPTGWHVPTKTELDNLIAYTGTVTSLKSTRKSPLAHPRWNYNSNGTDTTGYKMHPGGIRDITGDYRNIGVYGDIWSVTNYTDTRYAYNAVFIIDPYFMEYALKNNGSSVRIIKDSSSWTPGETVTDYDGNVYNTIQIDTQVWATSNLRVIHYNDGTIIPNVTNDITWAGLSSGAWCGYEGYERYWF